MFDVKMCTLLENIYKQPFLSKKHHNVCTHAFYYTTEDIQTLKEDRDNIQKNINKQHIFYDEYCSIIAWLCRGDQVSVKTGCKALDSHVACRKCALIEVVKVRMVHGLPSRDAPGRVIDQHFLQNKKKTCPSEMTTLP